MYVFTVNNLFHESLPGGKKPAALVSKEPALFSDFITYTLMKTFPFLLPSLAPKNHSYHGTRILIDAFEKFALSRF